MFLTTRALSGRDGLLVHPGAIDLVLATAVSPGQHGSVVHRSTASPEFLVAHVCNPGHRAPGRSYAHRYTHPNVQSASVTRHSALTVVRAERFHPAMLESLADEQAHSARAPTPALQQRQ